MTDIPIRFLNREDVVASGGGGWGAAQERAAHLVQRDEREGLLPHGTAGPSQ